MLKQKFAMRNFSAIANKFRKDRGMSVREIAKKMNSFDDYQVAFHGKKGMMRTVRYCSTNGNRTSREAVERWSFAAFRRELNHVAEFSSSRDWAIRFRALLFVGHMDPNGIESINIADLMLQMRTAGVMGAVGIIGFLGCKMASSREGKLAFLCHSPSFDSRTLVTGFEAAMSSDQIKSSGIVRGTAMLLSIDSSMIEDEALITRAKRVLINRNVKCSSVAGGRSTAHRPAAQQRRRPNPRRGHRKNKNFNPVNLRTAAKLALAAGLLRKTAHDSKKEVTCVFIGDTDDDNDNSTHKLMRLARSLEFASVADRLEKCAVASMWSIQPPGTTYIESFLQKVECCTLRDGAKIVDATEWLCQSLRTDGIFRELDELRRAARSVTSDELSHVQAGGTRWQRLQLDRLAAILYFARGPNRIEIVRDVLIWGILKAYSTGTATAGNLRLALFALLVSCPDRGINVVLGGPADEWRVEVRTGKLDDTLSGSHFCRFRVPTAESTKKQLPLPEIREPDWVPELIAAGNAAIFPRGRRAQREAKKEERNAKKRDLSYMTNNQQAKHAAAQRRKAADLEESKRRERETLEKRYEKKMQTNPFPVNMLRAFSKVRRCRESLNISDLTKRLDAVVGTAGNQTENPKQPQQSKVECLSVWIGDNCRGTHGQKFCTDTFPDRIMTSMTPPVWTIERIVDAVHLGAVCFVVYITYREIDILLQCFGLAYNADNSGRIVIKRGKGAHSEFILLQYVMAFHEMLEKIATKVRVVSLDFFTEKPPCGGDSAFGDGDHGCQGHIVAARKFFKLAKVGCADFNKVEK